MSGPTEPKKHDKVVFGIPAILFLMNSMISALVFLVTENVIAMVAAFFALHAIIYYINQQNPLLLEKMIEQFTRKGRSS